MTISQLKAQQIVGLALVGALALGMLFVAFTNKASAEAVPGTAATVATSSTLAVGPGNNMYAFGTTTREGNYQCAARIISTTGQPIMISFASLSSTTLSQTVGHQQAASTTVAYDGGIYGCGYMTIRGLNSSTTITTAETR
jgi:mitochondrial fission protein ELM1